MHTYKISKSTAAKAMALLSDIGLIHTIEKKGSVLRTSEELAPIRIEQNIIENNLNSFFKCPADSGCLYRETFLCCVFPAG